MATSGAVPWSRKELTQSGNSILFKIYLIYSSTAIERVTVMDFGKRLKELRLKRKMSLSEIASLAGVPLSSYQEWEQGRRILDVKIYFRLANALGVTVDYLIFGKEKEVSKELSLKTLDELRVKLDELRNLIVS